MVIRLEIGAEKIQGPQAELVEMSSESAARIDAEISKPKDWTHRLLRAPLSCKTFVFSKRYENSITYINSCCQE